MIFETITTNHVWAVVLKFSVLQDHDGHGPEFHKHMYRINGETGTNISVSLKYCVWNSYLKLFIWVLMYFYL